MAATLSDERAAGPNAISEALAQITARLRWARWVRHAARGALAGVCPALIAVVLAHFDLLPDWLPLEAAIPVPILLGILVGTVTTFLRPISRMDAARLAEARLGLKERLSSALEFEQASPHTDPEAAVLRRLQLADAAAHARTLNAAQAVPLRLPWEAKAAAAGLLLIALALILPSLPVFVPPALRVERQIVQKTGGRLEQTAKLIQKQADLQHLTGTRRAAAAMQRLGQRLASGRLDKKQAMVQMSTLSRQMRQELQKTAQANSAAGAGGKSMAQAGRLLAQAMAGGQNASGSGPQAGAGQKSGGGGSKSGQKAGQNGRAGSKNGQSKFSGFNVPTAGKSSASKDGQTPSQTPATPEIQKAAQAMQQNDSQALSQQLRQMADRVQSGKLSPGEQQQAASDVQKLADALKNSPMPETQSHAQAAADALKRGDKQTAASELRKAAASAEKEAQDQADQQGQQDAEQGVEDAESQMAGANSPGDISDDSGPPGSGQGKGQGKGQGSGQGQGDGLGDGQSLPNGNGKHGSGKGNGGSGGGGMAGGTPRDTGEGSSPLKHLGKAAPALNPKAVKLYFGKPLNSGPSKTGPSRKPATLPAPTASQVPYYNYVAPAQKSAESAMDKEDIPPAYRSDVRKYFNSLSPPAAGK